ncbi:MAG: hypothetical protein ACLTTE_04465 [Clostridia bacterium]
MTKEEIRNRVVEMASGSKGIIVSIPEALAMVGGEMYAYRLLDVAKVRVPQNENPMRCTSVLGGEIIAFTYADAQRLLANASYMEKFLEMSTHFCPVGDIYIFY